MIIKLKEQAARITMQKIIEICNLLPELAEEIDFSRGETQKGRDNVTFKWKNGSSIDILAATDSSRGQRRNCGIIEEARDCLNISFPIYQWGYALKVC